jgi:predicted acetyltransferase
LCIPYYHGVQNIIKLVVPHAQYVASYKASLLNLAQFQPHKAQGIAEEIAEIDDDAEKFCQKLAGHYTKDADDELNYWLVAQGEVVGIITLRPTLNNALRLHGGHVGYGVSPDCQNKGYATESLLQIKQLALQEFGLQELLLTCDPNNLASIRVIEKAGGQLKRQGVYKEKPINYYILSSRT